MWNYKLINLLKLMGQIIIINYIVACSSTKLPDSNEMYEIKNNHMAIVLIKIDAILENKVYKPFPSSYIEDNISFGLGDFDTGGTIRHIEKQRFLSIDSRDKGWTYFILEPGTYYLSVYPPRRTDFGTYKKIIKNSPIWKFEIPYNKQLVYIGTMELTGFADPLCCIFGDERMISIDHSKIRINTNSESEASLIVDKYFPELAGQLKTSALQKFEGGPIIIKHPTQ